MFPGCVALRGSWDLFGVWLLLVRLVVFLVLLRSSLCLGGSAAPFVVRPLLFWLLSLSVLLSLPRGLSCLVPWSSSWRRPCGVVVRTSFLTTRTDYRWWFDSPLVRR